MKDKILIFLIGLLLGAVITASCFLVYEKTNKNTNTDQIQNDERMQMMERPDGQTPPERPEGMENDGTRPEPPSNNGQNNMNFNNQSQMKEVENNEN
jgi:hypothetical protein